MTSTFVAGQTLTASSVNQELAFPTGLIVPYAGASAPGQGATTDPLPWLLCDGSEVSRTDYATLFAIIATTYGAGDGSTTFTLPDMRGRVPAGADNMGGTAASRLTSAASGVDGATLGAAGGAQTHTLTTAQMPSHSHGGVTGTTDVNHYHGSGNGQNFATHAGTQGASGLGAPSVSNQTATTNWSAISLVHSHSISAEGGGGTHNNTQPTIVLNYLIKT